MTGFLFHSMLFFLCTVIDLAPLLWLVSWWLGGGLL